MSRSRQEDYDAYIARGSDEDFLMTVRDPGTHQVVNLTGATVTCQLRDPDGNLLATGSVTIVDAEKGQVRVSFDNATTAGLPLGVALMDLRVEFQDGKVRYAPHKPYRAPKRVLVYDPATRGS